MSRILSCVRIFGFLLAVFGGAAYAANISWDRVTGNWTVGGNWTPAGPPAVGGTAIIDNDGTATVDTATIPFDQLIVGKSYTGTLILMGGGTVTSITTGIYLGYSAGSTGTIMVGGPGSELKTTANNLIVGNQGTGYLALTGGGKATVTSGDFVVGAGSGSNSSATGAVTVGAGSVLDVLSGGGFIGDYGAGLLAITGGGTANFRNDTILGFFDTGRGVARVDGAGSALNVTAQRLFVGYNGRGYLSLTGGGTATAVGHIMLGRFPTGDGMVLVGAGSLLETTEGNVYVGGSDVGAVGKGWLGGAGEVKANGGAGTVKVWGGTNSTNGHGTLAAGDRASGSAGALTIDGKLEMQDWSTLHLNHYGPGAGNNDLVTVSDTATFGANLNVSVASLTNLGDLQDKTLVHADGGVTPGATVGNLQLNGLDLTDSRAAGSGITLNQNANNLYVSGVTVGDTDNNSLEWLGSGAAAQPWDISTAGLWKHLRGGGIATKFLDGDYVWFNINGDNQTIDIKGSQKVVSRMDVSGDSDLTINGNILGDTSLSSLDDWGTLTKMEMGTLTLNGINRFVGDIELYGGATKIGFGNELNTDSRLNVSSAVGVAYASLLLKDGGRVSAREGITLGAYLNSTGAVVVDGLGSELKTAGSLTVGDNGRASLELKNGGTAAAAGNLFLGSGNTGFGAVIIGSGSTLTAGGNLYVGGNGTAAQGTGFIAGDGTVKTNTVKVYSSGGILLSNTLPAANLLTIDGNLTMDDTSLLALNPVRGDQLAVSGAADVGAIRIDLSAWKMGSSTVLTAAGGLDYSDGAATVLYNGAEVAKSGTRVVASAAASGDDLVVTFAGDATNKRLGWALSPGYMPDWDYTTPNWFEIGPSTVTTFWEGDAVTFDTTGDMTVTSVGARKTVAQMWVTGEGNLTIQGKILGDITGSTLAGELDITGGLTKTGGGTFTLNGEGVFNGGVFLDGGTTNIGAYIDPVTNLPATATLTAGSGRNLIVGNNGTGILNLTNGGKATSASTIYLGFNSNSKGTVTVDGTDSAGNASELKSTGGLLYVGNFGTGILNLTNGGKATSAGSIVLGFNSNSKGTVMVDGADSAGNASELKSTGGSLLVGYNGPGILNLTNGGKATSASDIYLGFGFGFGSKGTVMVGAGSTLSGANIFVGGDAASAAGTGWLGGAGTVVANGGGGTVKVWGGTNSTDGTGTLAAGDRTSATRGTMTITGKLVMEDWSTLHLNHYNATENDLVRVTGEVTFGANLNVSVASLANLGDLSAKPLVSTLSTTGATTPTGNLQLNGLDLSGSRAAGSSIALGKDLNNLYVSGATPFNADNTLVYWTGADVGHPTWWDITSENWTDYGSITKFLDGDQVTFNMTVANTVVNIQGSGKTVAQMGVTADYDLTINGNIYGDGSAEYTTLNNMSGGLNKVGMGTLTLNGVNLFRGNITLDGGVTNINGAPYSLTTGGELYVGQGIGSAATLNLTNGAKASAEAYITLGASDGSSGTITVDGTGSALENKTGSLYVGWIGTGNITLTNGGTATSASDIYLGVKAGSSGTVTVDGTGSTLKNKAGSLIVGDNGTGALTLTNGGTATSASDIYLGRNADSSGTVTVSAGSTLASTGGNIYVGGNATDPQGAGWLGGSGTVTANSGAGSVVVYSTGTLASTGGTLSVNGDLIFNAGSTYQVAVDPTTASRTNVTGTATLAGTANATFVPGSYVEKQYTILNATGGLGGTTFDTLTNTNLPANFTSSLSYDANNAYLDLTLAFNPPGGLNRNQQAVADTLVDYFNRTGGIPAAFGGMTAQDVTQSSGELATGSQQAGFDAMGQFMGVMDDGTRVALCDDEASRKMRRCLTGEGRAWASVYGGNRRTDGDNAQGSNKATNRLWGVAMGGDIRVAPDTIFGLALAGGDVHFDVDHGLGSGKGNLFQIGAYVRHEMGPAYISGAVAYGRQDVTTDRTVTIDGTDRLHASFNTHAYAGRVEGGWRFVSGAAEIGPYVAGQVTRLNLPAYSEKPQSGSDTFALNYDDQTVSVTRSELGMRASAALGGLTLGGKLAWAHDSGTGRKATAGFITLPDTSFTVHGAEQAGDAALASVFADIRASKALSFGAAFDGEFSSLSRAYAGKVMLRYSW